MQRHWALRLRLSVLMLLFLGAIAEHTGASLLVAGFAAGIVLAVGMALAATAVHLVAAILVEKERRLPAGLLASAQLGLPAAAAALGLATGARSAHRSRPLSWRADC
jgi:hypothetical protein